MMRTNTRVTARLAATMPPAIAPSLPGSVIGRWVAAATPVSEMQDTSHERWWKGEILENYWKKILKEKQNRCNIISVIFFTKLMWRHFMMVDWIEFYAVSAIFQPCNGGTFYVFNHCGTISKLEPYKVVQVMKRSSCLDIKCRRTWG